MATREEIAKRIGASTGGGGGEYFRHGRYLLMIKRWFLKNEDNGAHKGTSEVHEFVVMNAEPKVVVQDDKEIRQTPNQIGSQASWVLNYDGPAKTMAPINSTEFVNGFHGYVQGEISADEKNRLWMEGTDDKQPCRGMLVAVDTRPIKTGKGNWIIGMNWTCVARPGTGLNTAAAAKARWSEYEAKQATIGQGTSPVVAAVPASNGVSHSNGTASDVSTHASAPVTAPAVTAPTIPAAPSVPVAPPIVPLFPPAGWTLHPQAPGFYYKGQDVKAEADLRSMMASGTA